MTFDQKISQLYYDFLLSYYIVPTFMPPSGTHYESQSFIRSLRVEDTLVSAWEMKTALIQGSRHSFRSKGVGGLGNRPC